MQIQQNDLEFLKDQMSKGLMTAAQANVAKVRMQRVLLVKGRLTTDFRKSLNAAVKAGELGHLKKYGNKPEAYFHPTFDYLAKGERTAHELSVYRALQSVCA